MTPTQPKYRTEVRRMPQGKRGRKEVLRTASCTLASLQRAQNVTVTSEGKNVKGAVPGQEDGKDRGGRECNQSYRKTEAETVQFSKLCRGKKVMVLGKARAYCSIGRLSKGRRKPRWSTHDRSPQSAACSLYFVLDGIKRFQDCQSSRSYRFRKEAT